MNKSPTTPKEHSISPLYGDKKVGMRKRINDNCYECIYDDKEAGNWRQQVAACEITRCQFWDIRPISKPKVIKVVKILEVK